MFADLKRDAGGGVGVFGTIGSRIDRRARTPPPPPPPVIRMTRGYGVQLRNPRPRRAGPALAQ